MALDLAVDLRWALSPVDFARDALGFQPDPWQERVLSWRGKRLILNCCRQSGKSTTTGIVAAHEALYHPGSLTLLISPSLRQSSELFKKVTDQLARLPADAQPERPEDNKLSLQFATGSRIVSLPSTGATVRGFSAVDLVIEDEAAWVPDVLRHAISPMLAVSGGRLVLMSTPFGKRGHFSQTWHEGGPEWERIQVTAYDVPRISRDFLEQERRDLGRLVFQSEYECVFSENANSLFTGDDLAAMFASDLPPLFDVGGDGAAPHDPLASDLSPLFMPTPTPMPTP